MTFEPFHPDRSRSRPGAENGPEAENGNGPATEHSARYRARPSWPTAFDDPQAQDVREGWSTLDRLLRDNVAGPLAPAAAADLVRRVQLRVRRRRLRRWGAAALAAAACAAGLTLGWRFFPSSSATPAASSEDRVAAVDRHASGGAASATATADATAVGAALANRFSAAFAEPAGPWDDPLADDLREIQSYALDVEIGWRRRTDLLSDLRQRFEEVQSSWDERSL